MADRLKNVLVNLCNVKGSNSFKRATFFLSTEVLYHDKRATVANSQPVLSYHKLNTLRSCTSVTERTNSMIISQGIQKLLQKVGK